MSSQRYTLDSPFFVGLVKDYSRRSSDEGRPDATAPQPVLVSDILLNKPTLQPQSFRQPMDQAIQPLQQHPNQLPDQQPSSTLANQSLPKNSFQPQSTQAIVQQTAPLTRRLGLTNALMMAMAATVFLFGVGVAVMGLRTNKHVAAQVSHVAQTVNNDAIGTTAPPDETKPNPSTFSSYVVSPSQPRLLKIPKLAVTARVRKLGVNSQNQLQAPNNIDDTGWYDNSAKPGDTGGAILIDGHVHGPSLPGVFYKLKTLKLGDVVQVERGDGKVFNFKVIKSQAYPVDKVDMGAALVSADPGKLGLNLMTCTGKVDLKTETYDQRLVVFAVAQ